MKNFFVSIICIMFFLASCSMNDLQGGAENDGADSGIENLTVSNNLSTSGEYRAPSQDPPGGLKPEECPQLIILGFDDNQFADGMLNTLAVYDGKINPAGTGQAATFDGSPVTVSFYNTPGGRDAASEWTVGQDTIDAWKLSYQKGHEIGNHTYYHEHGLQFDQARWVSEMNKCNEFLVNTVGIPQSDLIGFRTPFLEYNPAAFQAMKQVGITYDVSFEGGWRYWPTEDGSTLYWPYTMDDGKPAGSEARDFGKVPGLWQIPNDCVFFPGGRTTGFDYNLWFSKSTTKDEFVSILKYSLDKKYNGNRSPMKFGLHTNYYSDDALEEMKIYDAASVAKLKATTAERTAALAEFLAYALTLPDVRVVSAKEALTWIRNPVALGSGPVEQVTITATAGNGGSITPAGAVKVNKGGSITFTAKPDAGNVVDAAVVDGQTVQLVDNQYTFSNVQKDSVINVTFKAGKTYTVTATSGDNGSFDKEGAIVVAEGGSISFIPQPMPGYEIDTVTVDGAVIAPPYELTNITADHVIHVTFKKIVDNGVKAVYEITQDWGSGFGGQVTITNNSTAPIDSWTVTWTYAGTEKVTSLWNASYVQEGNKVTVSNLSWNGTLGVGKSVTFGFNGTYSGNNGIPSDITVQ